MAFSKAYLVIALIVACVALSLVNGHPDGAPESQCDTMTVLHDNPDGPQPNPTSYMIMLGSATVPAGGTLSVYIMSDDPTSYFEGILVKAIDASQAETDYSGTAGSFVIADADLPLFHYLNCSGVDQSAVTHSAPDNKIDVTFTWQAPATAGSYAFLATVAQDHEVYWLTIRSASVEVTAA